MKKFFLFLLLTLGIALKLYIHINKNPETKAIHIKLKPVIIVIKPKINLDSIIRKLMIIESNSNPNAIGDNGTAIGLLQIRPICVKDINRLYKTSFKHKDALDSLKSVSIAKLYLKKGIELYVKKHNKYPSEEEIVRMWNGGIYKGYKNKLTEKYYNKYKKL